MGLPLETLLLIGILATNVFYIVLHAPLVLLFVRLRRFLVNFLGGFTNPQNRAGLWSEVAHGVFRAIREQAGSAAGVAAKQQKAGLLDLALQGGGAGAAALSQLPGKIDLPVVGKVTIGEALQLFMTLKGVLGGGGLNLSALTGQASGSTSGWRPPP
jgi:hypothetical protein